MLSGHDRLKNFATRRIYNFSQALVLKKFCNSKFAIFLKHKILFSHRSNRLGGLHFGFLTKKSKPEKMFFAFFQNRDVEIRVIWQSFAFFFVKITSGAFFARKKTFPCKAVQKKLIFALHCCRKRK
jgi:hypothetical protein